MKPIKFNPNDPKLWKDFDPTEQAEDFVDGKSQSDINRGTANRIKAQDPEFQKKRLDGLSKVIESDNWKQGQVQRGINRKNNPKLKKEQSELMTRQNLDPVKKEKRVKAMKEAWSNPELKKKHSEESKEFWSRPENKAKRLAHGLKCSKPVMTPAGEFQTAGKAGEHFCKEWGLAPRSAGGRVKNLILNKEPNWYYIKK